MGKVLDQSNIPEKWQKRYVLKRIGEEPIEITWQQYNALYEAIEGHEEFIQINEHIVKINNIKGVDPKWDEANIPPKPKPLLDYEPVEGGVVKEVLKNGDELREWDKLFKNKLTVI